MSARRIGSAGLIGGVAAGLVLLVALGLIGLGLSRMTTPDEATPFRSACQGDDACRQALAERLPALQAAPGGAVAWVHEALTRSAPLLPADATLAACQTAATPETCLLDPVKLKPGEAGALVAVFDAYSLAQGRQARACRYLDGCATRALAALGEYGFDPTRVQGALQRTSLPLPPPLKVCAEASADAVRGACRAEALLQAAPEPLTVALEQDWRSGGDRARLPQPADPQVELTKNALWAGLGSASGMLLMGLIWVGTSLGKARLTKTGDAGAVTAGAPAMSAAARRIAPDAKPPIAPAPDPFGQAARSVARPRAQAPATPASRPIQTASSERPTTPPAGAPPPPTRPAISPAAVDARAINPTAPPEMAAFQTALALPGPAENFARLATDEAARLSPRFDEGERLAAGAILAAHRLRGDRPAEAHAGAYDDMVFALAGPDHRLVWPRGGAPITAEMDTCEDGDLYSHAVEAVLRPGLADGSGTLMVRPRVRAR